MTTNTTTPAQDTLIGLIRDRMNPGGDPGPLDVVDVAIRLDEAAIDECLAETIRRHYAGAQAGEAVALIAREREITPAEAIAVLAADIGATPAAIDRLL